MDDVIAFLKEHSVGFTEMALAVQITIKENRSRPDLDLQQKDGGTIRRFNRKWYDSYPWLTGSIKLNKLFCLVCAVYGGESTWGRDGIDVIKNFTSKAEKHQSSKRHIKNMELFLMVGKDRRVRVKEKLQAVDAQNYKDEENRRREIMSQIMDAIFFLIKQKRDIRDSDEIDKISLEDLIIKRFLYDTSKFKKIYGNMHKELIASMESVLLENIRKEINESEFCSLQTDEIPDRDGEFSVIIRYAHKGFIKERFIGFFEIRSIFDLGHIINTTIGDARKLVCHSHDGSVSMKLIRHGIKSIMPKVLFVNNHIHKLNMLLLQGFQNNKECKVYTSQVSFIYNFFRVPGRSAKLRKEGVLLSSYCETLWKFNSKTISTIIKNYAKISKVVNDIIIDRSTVDLDALNDACCVQNLLKNHSFVLFSVLFNKIFVYADYLSNVIYRKINSYVDICIQEIAQTLKNISNFKTDIIIKHCVEETKTHLKIQSIPVETVVHFKTTAFLVIDGVVDQIEERYRDTIFFKFVELVDKTRFIHYKNKFPKSMLQEFVKNFPDYFDIQRLENELTIIYGDAFKRFTPYQLFTYLYDNDLTELYRETFKLLRLYLTFPLTPADPGESCCTLSKIRNYLNHYGNLKKSALLYVEKYPSDSSDYIVFKEKVIDHFDECKKNKK